MGKMTTWQTLCHLCVFSLAGADGDIAENLEPALALDDEGAVEVGVDATLAVTAIRGASQANRYVVLSRAQHHAKPVVFIARCKKKQLIIIDTPCPTKRPSGHTKVPF